ncbi:MAG: hypothetical protein GY866_09930 [Proteobacteria bacterium]|nr:hypothetical protein [Pseudomonadota bacterium]
MRIKIMTLSFSSRLGDFDTTALESFLADKEISKIDHHFFEHHQKPFLTVVLQYEPAVKLRSVEPGKNAGAKSEADPKNLLTEAEWPLFETLRQWRNERAKQDGIPHYSVFKNQVLVDLVKKRPSTLAQLQTVSGIGQNKAAKYGESLLAMVAPKEEVPTSLEKASEPNHQVETEPASEDKTPPN